MSPYTASEIIDNSNKYPKTYKNEGKKTKHKDPEDKPIEIIEEISEYIQLGKSKNQYCLIINGNIVPL